MRLGPFTLARTKTIELQAKLLSSGSLQTIPGWRRGWFPWIQEPTTGGWQRNEDIRADAALRNPTLYACVISIAQDIAKLRPMLVEQDAEGIWTEIETNNPILPVLGQPNAYQTWTQYTEWYYTSKLLAGNVYVLKERDQRGIPRALYVLDPCRVTPMLAPDGSVFYQLQVDQLNQVDNVIVPAREIIHDRMVPLFHPLVGISPIYAAGFPAILGLNLRDAQDKFVSNGSRPGGILTVPGTLTEAQVAQMKTDWTTAFSGDNQGAVAVLTGGMSYSSMGMMTAEQSRLIELIHMTDEDIAKCFRMPRHKVGIGPDPTYTNIQAKNQDYLNDCLQPHINDFQILHTKGCELDNMPGTKAIELDADDLMLLDTAAKADAAQKALNAGMSYDEARLRFWDLGPVKGGDSPLAQQQYYSLEALANRDAAPPTTAPTPEPVAVPEPDEAKELPLSAALALMEQKILMLDEAA